MTGSLCRKPEKASTIRVAARATSIHLRRNILKRASIFLFVCLVASATAVDYQITRKIPIPGKGSWDYLVVDEGGRRLYVSHGTQVEVLDVDSGEIVGKVENTPGVHGIAIAPELGRGFVSNGQSSTVTIFDLKTLKAIAEVPVGCLGRHRLRSGWTWVHGRKSALRVPITVRIEKIFSSI